MITSHHQALSSSRCYPSQMPKGFCERWKKSSDNVQEIGRKDWVFPPELKSQLPMMQRLKDLGAVSWEHRFGTQIWTTTIVCARTPANGGR